MVKVKFLFIELSVQDGEREHTHRILETTKCENIDFAAAWYAAHFWGETSSIDKETIIVCDGDGTARVKRPIFYQHGGEIAVKVEKVKKLTKREYNLLNKLIYG